MNPNPSTRPTTEIVPRPPEIVPAPAPNYPARHRGRHSLIVAGVILATLGFSSVVLATAAVIPLWTIGPSWVALGGWFWVWHLAAIR